MGITIGFLADRTKATLWVIISFILSIVGSFLFASGVISPNTVSLFFISTVIIGVGIYAARSLYFATMGEGRIPLMLTGTAVGIISLVGYTPDIFVGLIRGPLLDENPGKIGLQNIFIVLGIFSIVGCIAAMLLYRINNKKGAA